MIAPVTQAPAAILYLAKAAAPLAGAAGDIQMFPPGRQVLVPFAPNADPKKKREPISVTIDAATAEALEACRAEYQARADRGEGDAPFFDFNHDDAEASAWPKRIYWAGDDPLLGGVRAEVEWSSAGEEAVNGKTFRRFSPAFYQPEADRITAAPVNMGGLVNRAAFTRIQPLFAKAPEAEVEIETETEPDPTMSPEEIAALQAENEQLKAKLADMQAQLDTLTAQAKAACETDAKNTVALAAKEGRIPPGEEIQAKWVAAIVADPSAKELLLAMAPNPALAGRVVAAKAAPDADAGGKQTVQAKSGLEAAAEAIKAQRKSEDR